MTVLDYRPSAELDAEIAQLVVEGIRGWPDHGPLSAEMVRSGLRATGTIATTLVLHRDEDGVLEALGAIRWPASIEAEGVVLGPIVRPTARGAGLASTMLDELSQVVASRPDLRVRTAPIPDSRTTGWALFERAGWLGSGTSTLLKRDLPAPDATGATVSVRPARQGEYLDQALATLFAAARPTLGYATARDTFQRWAADVRYVPEGLLLAEGPSALLGAALVYPSARRAPDPGTRQSFSRVTPEPAARDEPAEALLADLITAPDLDPDQAQAVRASLVQAALTAGARAGAQVVRAESDTPELIATLRAAGFEVVDQFRFYTPPVRPSGPVIAG